MSDVLNLYLVTCVDRQFYGTNKKLVIYVLAPEPTIAANKALAKMKELEYRYTDWVEDVQLIAAPSPYRGPNILAE